MMNIWRSIWLYTSIILMLAGLMLVVASASEGAKVRSFAQEQIQMIDRAEASLSPDSRYWNSDSSKLVEHNKMLIKFLGDTEETRWKVGGWLLVAVGASGLCFAILLRKTKVYRMESNGRY